MSEQKCRDCYDQDVAYWQQYRAENPWPDECPECGRPYVDEWDEDGSQFDRLTGWHLIAAMFGVGMACALTTILIVNVAWAIITGAWG